MGTFRFVVPLLLAAGCEMSVVRDPGSDTGEREVFNTTVAPLLAGNCTVCHYTGGNLIPLTYDSIVASPNLNGGYDPEAASLLNKGVHEGPAWNGVQTTTIVEWLYAEGASQEL
jgi:hypothetical protein